MQLQLTEQQLNHLKTVHLPVPAGSRVYSRHSCSFGEGAAQAVIARHPCSGQLTKLTKLMWEWGARRRVMLLVQAGKPVDATIQNLMQYLEEGDIIIDGGNEW